MGSTCVTSGDCQFGLTCEDNFCIAGEGDNGNGEPSDPSDAPRFFLHLGLTGGFAYVSSNMRADGPPPDMTDEYVPGGGGGAYVNPMNTDEAQPCDADPNFDDYCVRVETPGFVPTIAIRATAGYYFTERIGAALTFRFQPSAGQGAFSSILLGVRGQYLVTAPAAEGLNAAIFLGTSYGQIQPQPPQGSQNAPFIRAGLNGIQVGTVLGYRVAKNFGFNLTPEVHILLPLFLFNIDLTAGLEVGF